MKFTTKIGVTILSILSCTQVANAIPAFPGAEGGGANTIGGRGGVVYEVINLNDHGEGSLRYGLTSAEFRNRPRTIVFKVGGYIHLESSLFVFNDAHITIAGQTAPGDGITIVYPSSPNGGVIEFRNTQNVIMRYIRIKKGGGPPAGYNQQGSNLSLIGDVNNIIVDHCSIGWAGDENFGGFNVHPGGAIVPNKISFQWSISSENLRRPTTVNGKNTDSTGFFMGSSTNPETSVDVSVHHNLFARNNNRNPNFKNGSGDISANIIYNWQWYASAVRGGVIVDIVDNFYKAGPARDGGDRRPEITHIPALEGVPETGVFRDPSIFMAGNIGYHNADPNVDAWDTMMHLANQSFGYLNGVVTPVPRAFQRQQMRDLEYPISRENALTLDVKLFAENGIGASQRLAANGAWVNNRDTTDTRVINDYRNGTGDTLVASVDAVGGWPYFDNGVYRTIPEAQFIANPNLYQLDPGVAYADTDHDGMPDLWEDSHGLNRNSLADNIQDSDGDGYTNLEEFLNGTSPITNVCQANYGLPNNSWRMVSLPCQPPQNANTLAAVFGDDIVGTYGDEWRVFTYNSQLNPARYEEVALGQVLEQGKGYWIITTTGNVTLDMPAGSTSTTHRVLSSACVSAVGCFETPLETEAGTNTWNMVGNPHLSFIEMNNIRIRTDSATAPNNCADANGCTLVEAQADGIVDNKIWGFPDPVTGGYRVFDSGDTLNPWGGYWIATIINADSRNPRLLLP
ncbi:MAG: hypothetical protein KAH20_15245 [Methylococcales bacterium]|nr:hypothetical protein [Methylococcales bacterium]